jgi:DNA primase
VRLQKQFLEKLIQYIPLQDHLRRFLEIKRSGTMTLAKCPFHPDSNPSFYIYTQNYHCFACKAHGNIIDYEMHRTGLSFREAVESLAQAYGIPIEYESVLDKKSIEFFESQTQSLETLFRFFKTNLDFLIPDQQNLSIVKNVLRSEFKKNIDFYYTGQKVVCDSFVKDNKLVGFKNIDFSERFAFPLYRENDRISGFAFSNKVTKFKVGNQFEESFFFDFFSDFFIYTPFPKFNLTSFHWNVARVSAVQMGELFLTSNAFDFFQLMKKNIKNVVFCINKKTDFLSLRVFSKRISKLTIVISSFYKEKDFLWKSFLETLSFSNLDIGVIELCSDSQSLGLNFYSKISYTGLMKKLSYSEPIWKFVTKKILEKVPQANKLSLFKSRVFPVLEKMSDRFRKEIILEEIARLFFGSSQKIFYSTNLKEQFYENNSFLLKNNVPLNENIYIQFMKKTIEFYHKILFSHLGIQARAYLRERGFTDLHMQKWKLGYCPETNLLSAKIAKNLISQEIPIELCLIKRSRNQKNRFYDFFHHRILIPIYSHQGFPIAFSGRFFSQNLTEDEKSYPKYMNSPESEIFAKSEILFHYHEAMSAIVRERYVIVVEGYMDCISLVNAGIENTVAVMGTSLTQLHLQALLKITKKIILCFDSDKAGKDAAKKTFTLACPIEDLELEYLSLPGAKDPDEFLKIFGAQEFLKLIFTTQPLVLQICDWLFEEAHFESDSFLRMIKELIFPIMKKHPQKAFQQRILALLHEKYFQNLQIQNLWKELEDSHVHHKQNFLQSDHAQDSKSASFDAWPVVSPLEVKLLLAFVHAKFVELPLRLRHVATGVVSGTEADERICEFALNDQISKKSKIVLFEMISFMLQDHEQALIDSPNFYAFPFSDEVKILVAYAGSRPEILSQYQMEELLKEHLSAQQVMVSFRNIWDLKNSGFLRFQLRSIKLSSQRGVLSAYLAETLLRLELDYIDNALKAFLSLHSENEINKQFQYLVHEKARRRKEFAAFDVF